MLQCCSYYWNFIAKIHFKIIYDNVFFPWKFDCTLNILVLLGDLLNVR